jgi:hypothetical protein
MSGLSGVTGFGGGTGLSTSGGFHSGMLIFAHSMSTVIG